MKRLIKFILVIIAIYIFLWANNEWLVMTEHTYSSDKIPSAFDGYKIVQVSDLHDANLGENHSRLVNKVLEVEPDVIVITGDVIDSRRFDLENSLQAVRQLAEIAPVYYVIGNHEVASNKVQHIYSEFESIGVKPLKNEHVTLEKDGQSIILAGIEDPLMGLPVRQAIEKAYVGVSENQFSVLISHRPEVFKEYVNANVPVALTGHAHGGQVRIPFVGGLIAPTQGWFPEYTAGKYEDGETSMYVSRGLGNSVFPLRIFNRPQLIKLTLSSKND